MIEASEKLAEMLRRKQNDPAQYQISIRSYSHDEIANDEKRRWSQTLAPALQSGIEHQQITSPEPA